MRAIYERGIGEDRAVVMAGDRLIEAHIERPGVRVGDVWDTRLLRVVNGRGVVALADEQAELAAAPTGVAEGGLVRVAVTREGLPGFGRGKPARVEVVRQAAGTPGRVRAGPDLRERLAARGLDITDTVAHGPDLLADAGWFETIEEATLRDPIGFPGGALSIDRTEAMVVIDVDGHLPPAELALASARAAGAAIRRLGIGGSTVIDFPTVGDRDVRKRVGEELDAVLPAPFERTAMNGFGLVQIVRPRTYRSLIEQVAADKPGAEALRLLRIAERAGGAGTTTISALALIIRWLEERPHLVDELRRRTGRPVELRVDATQPMSGGHVHVG